METKIIDKEEHHWSGFEYTDPSFGVVRFSRITGNSRLFQSNCDLGSFIELTISTAVLCRHTDTHSDYVHDDEELIRISLSNAQFAELITNMNVGTGVPCTINNYGKERYECPELVKKIDTYQVEFDKRIESISEGLVKQYEEISDMLDEKGSPTKKKLNVIQGKLYSLLGNFKSNSNFFKKCFKEDTNKIISDSKIEVESFISMHMHDKGVEAIEAMRKIKNDELIEKPKKFNSYPCVICCGKCEGH
jgi:ElaB/YqjD/DUF883 family membrane-anchored ribosome-binding protein